ncbi:MAG: putative photosynthetic complex assembly protein PuhE [Hyphomicrobium sp.]
METSVYIYVCPVLYAIFTWWFLTGAVLYVVGLPRRSVRWTMSCASGVLAAALFILWQTSDDTTPKGAYIGFTSALLVWGWHEMSFLTGMVTGPRTTECPKPILERASLWAAIEALLYHEVALFVTVLLFFVMLEDASNKIALYTFTILWFMRLSAKLNIYLGVPNITEEFLPQHLTYLKTYFCRRAMNFFFPLSVTLASIATWLLIADAAVTASPFEVTTSVFLAALSALGLIEHWFLVLPLPSAALWSWGLWSRSQKTTEEEKGTATLSCVTVPVKVEAIQPVRGTFC